MKSVLYTLVMMGVVARLRKQAERLMPPAKIRLSLLLYQVKNCYAILCCGESVLILSTMTC